MSRATISRQRGFTLLELLVATVLLALIAFVLLNGVHFGTQVWARTAAQVDRSTDRAALDAFLRRQLSRIYPYPADERGGKRIIFAGTRESLRFVGPEPVDAAVAGTYLFDLHVSTDGQRDLVLSWSAVGTGAYPGRLVLMRHVQSVEIAYFGALGRHGRAAWSGAWLNSETLPRLISLRIAGKGKAAGDPVEIVVAPRLSGAVERNAG